MLPYVSPSQMADYRQKLLLFAKGAPSLECVSSHYFPDHTGTCDLTGAKEQDVIFVLANRAGSTMKVSESSMQIVANVLDIKNSQSWFEHLKEQRKQHRERLALEQKLRDEARESAPRTVVIRKRKLETVVR